MAYADIGGLRLFFEERGSGGRPLVFVHGWCCDHTFFAPQVEHFARGRRVVAVDLRGCGRSDRPDPGEAHYDTAAFADDVAALCHELSLDGPVVVGHSMGAASPSNWPLATHPYRRASWPSIPDRSTRCRVTSSC